MKMGRDTIVKYGTFWHTIKVLLYIRGWWGVGMPGCPVPGCVELVVGMPPCVGVTKPPFGAPTHMENCWNPTLNVVRTVGVVVHRATVRWSYQGPRWCMWEIVAIQR